MPIHLSARKKDNGDILQRIYNIDRHVDVAPAAKLIEIVYIETYVYVPLVLLHSDY